MYRDENLTSAISKLSTIKLLHEMSVLSLFLSCAHTGSTRKLCKTQILTSPSRRASVSLRFNNIWSNQYDREGRRARRSREPARRDELMERDVFMSDGFTGESTRRWNLGNCCQLCRQLDEEKSLMISFIKYFKL